jgi:phage tail tape-measure protein
LVYSIKYIKYDTFFCNNINEVLKKNKLDDKTLFITIEYYIYAYIYRKLLQYIYLYKQDIYEQDIYEHWDAAKKWFDKVGQDAKKGFDKFGKNAKKDFDKFGKNAKKDFDKFGREIQKGIENIGNDFVDQITGTIKKLENSGKCLAKGDINCVFKNIKDIAVDYVPAINVLDKLARGEKLTSEDMIMLAISVAPIPGGAVVGTVGKTVGKAVGKTVGKAVGKTVGKTVGKAVGKATVKVGNTAVKKVGRGTATAVVKTIMHDPKVKSKVENVVKNARAKNKNITPKELNDLVAKEINQI